MLRAVAVLLFAFLLAPAQAKAADFGSITVTVVEQGSHALIEGAHVALAYRVTRNAPEGSSSTAGGVTVGSTTEPCVTTLRGTCRFPLTEPGSYMAMVSGDGYFMAADQIATAMQSLQPEAVKGYRAGAMSAGGGSTPMTVNVPADAKPRDYEITLTVYRAAVLTGHLIDRSTQEPLEGLQVTALFLGSPEFSITEIPQFLLRNPVTEGDARAVVSRSESTDHEGAFRIDNLRPGAYKLQIRDKDQITFLDGLQPDYGEAFPQPVGYSARIWPPGNLNPESAITLNSGVTYDFGKIDIDKHPLARIRARVWGPPCAEDDAYLLQLYSGAIHRGATAPCDGFTIEKMPGGEYRLQAWRDADEPADKVYGSASAVVSEGADLELQIPVSKPLPVTGTVSCDCAGTNPVKSGKLRITISPAGQENSGYLLPGIGQITAEGSFEALAFPSEHWEITGLGKGYYVASIQYNGVDVPELFSPNLYSGSHKLKVVVSDKTSTVQGSVTSRDSGPANGIVLIARWPLRPATGLRGTQSAWQYELAQIDASGRYAFTGLAPGKYRIIALDRPAANVSQALASGTEITLSAGEVKSHSLELRTRN